MLVFILSVVISNVFSAMCVLFLLVSQFGERTKNQISIKIYTGLQPAGVLHMDEGKGTCVLNLFVDHFGIYW